MCLFRNPTPAPMPTPAPIQPRQPDVVNQSRLPSKKELVDPDETAGVEYGTTAATKTKGSAKKTGTDALKINLNTGTGMGSGTGGVNTGTP